MDWIDEEKRHRDAGKTRLLTQHQHTEVNARYPGATLERCFRCDEPTGRAGKGDDSMYLNDEGPYCEECFDREAEL